MAEAQAIVASKRILFLGAREARILDVVKDLTGSAPKARDSGSIAGLTHEWSVQTDYYKSTVPIWIDEVEDVGAWQAEFQQPEAKEVVEAVGAWVYCFRREVAAQGELVPAGVLDSLQRVREVLEHHDLAFNEDTVRLAVAVPTAAKSPASGAQLKQPLHAWEDDDAKCREQMFEFIDYAATGTNEYQEKVGLERLREALEAGEWGALEGEDGDADGLGDLDFDVGDDVDDFARDEAEMTAEIWRMKAALNGEEDLDDPHAEDFAGTADEARQVEDLDRLMSKLLAIKEQSADLPEAQRKRLAAKAVRELMQSK